MRMTTEIFVNRQLGYIDSGTSTGLGRLSLPATGRNYAQSSLDRGGRVGCPDRSGCVDGADPRDGPGGLVGVEDAENPLGRAGFPGHLDDERDARDVSRAAEGARRQEHADRKRGARPPRADDAGHRRRRRHRQLRSRLPRHGARVHEAAGVDTGLVHHRSAGWPAAAADARGAEAARGAAASRAARRLDRPRGMGPLHHARITDDRRAERLQQRRPDRPGPRHGRHPERDDPRDARHQHQRRAAPEPQAEALGGRRAGPLGGRHARRRDQELRWTGRAGRREQERDADGAFHAPRAGRARVSLYG